MKKIAFAALVIVGFVAVLGASVHAASGEGMHGAYCLVCDVCLLMAHVL